MEIKSVKKIDGVIFGSVIYSVRRKKPAPSMRAASNISALRCDRAVMSKTIFSPQYFHRYKQSREEKAEKSEKYAFHTEMIVADGKRNGRKNADSISVSLLNSCVIATEIVIEMTMIKVTAHRVNRAVFPNASLK